MNPTSRNDHHIQLEVDELFTGTTEAEYQQANNLVEKTGMTHLVLQNL